MALNIPSLPIDLLDGTPADASQVMQNFNAIVTAVNANVASVGGNPLINFLTLALTASGLITANGGLTVAGATALATLTASGAVTILNAAAPNQPVALGQANALYAALAGLSTQVFNAAPATGPTEVAVLGQLFGTTLQAWSTPPRAMNTPYTNDTGRSISVLVCVAAGTANFAVQFLVNGVAIATTNGDTNANTYHEFSVTVPNGATYEVSGQSGVSIQSWAELS